MKKQIFLSISAAAMIFAACGCTPWISVKISDDTLSASESLRNDIAAEDIAEHNLSLVSSPIATQPEAVKLYISADGNEETISRTLSQIKEISDDVCSGIANDYDKLYALAEYVSTNYYYDYDAKEEGVTDETVCLAHTLETRRSVCMGYANLFAALCRAQGIDCYIAHGGAIVLGSFETNDDVRLHEWNVAIIDGRVIWVDTLWNTSNAYRNGEYHEGTVDNHYFDIDNDALAEDHRADRIESRDYFSAAD